MLACITIKRKNSDVILFLSMLFQCQTAALDELFNNPQEVRSHIVRKSDFVACEQQR